MSSKRLEDLINAGLVSSVSDLYRLTAEDLMKIEKIKDKLSSKVIESIQKSKKSDLIVFLSALGISGGAFNKCEKVVRAGFDTIEKIKNITLVEIISIESFAEKSATEFLSSLTEKKILIDELIECGFTFSVNKTRQTKITGKKICITGALSEKRPIFEDIIREAGGIIVSSVSKNTDILVTNETDPASSKFKKALDLKINIISESELIELLK